MSIRLWIKQALCRHSYQKTDITVSGGLCPMIVRQTTCLDCGKTGLVNQGYDIAQARKDQMMLEAEQRRARMPLEGPGKPADAIWR